MADPSNIPVCVLAGGTSQRFGSDKALAPLGGRPLIDHVLRRIALQTRGPIIVNANAHESYSSLGTIILADGEWRNVGPLAGVFSALVWAKEQGFETIATCAVDLPFIAGDFLSKLEAVGAPAIASSQGRWHPVNGQWTADLSDQLDAYLSAGTRSAHGWAEACVAKPVEFEAEQGAPDPFWNVNTPSDMRIAERIWESLAE
mgnify:CR=1 FL=1